MNKVFVLDTNKQPLDFCHPGQARRLLKAGLAAVYRRFPFVIILKREVTDPQLQPYRLKIDPGSKKTGIAIINERTGEIVFAAEIEHRGEQIKDALNSRRAVRRGRRNRKTRYRKPRFSNRSRKPGWLPPSLLSRIANIETWVRRLCCFCPIAAISQELVKFDTQLMQKAEISSVEYQQGTLEGYEVREYLLEKFGRKCVYCGDRNVAFQIDHIYPRSRGGSNRVSNLALACGRCNQKKGDKTAEEFGHAEVQQLAKAPLKDAAAMNATRWELNRRLQTTGLAVECGSGGLTKFNRTQRNLPKAHWIDAACVGASTPEKLDIAGVKPLAIKATGHGVRQRCGTDKYGFPFRHSQRGKNYLGFQTGDMVRAVVPKGKYAGTNIGRIAIRFQPSFKLNGFFVHPKYLERLHRVDGYNYAFS